MRRGGGRSTFASPPYIYTSMCKAKCRTLWGGHIGELIFLIKKPPAPFLPSHRFGMLSPLHLSVTPFWNALSATPFGRAQNALLPHPRRLITLPRPARPPPPRTPAVKHVLSVNLAVDACAVPAADCQNGPAAAAPSSACTRSPAAPAHGGGHQAHDIQLCTQWIRIGVTSGLTSL